jgi:hypothetical protein
MSKVMSKSKQLKKLDKKNLKPKKLKKWRSLMMSGNLSNTKGLKRLDKRIILIKKAELLSMCVKNAIM